jgi:hypothetical protein
VTEDDIRRIVRQEIASAIANHLIGAEVQRRVAQNMHSMHPKDRLQLGV